MIIPREIKPFRPPCDASSEMVNVKVTLNRDISELLPYVKGALEGVRFFPKGPFVKFTFQGHPVTIEHDCVAIAGFGDDVSARECAGELVKLLNDVEARKDEITPDVTPFNPPTVIDVYKLLPGRNGCGECGYPTCMAFAAALVKGETEPGMCPQIRSGAAGEGVLERLKRMLGA